MRTDGRSSGEIRPMSASVGELDRADGSGRFGYGPVAALASFTGPIEVRLREEKISESTLEVVHRPLEGVGGTSSRALETVLHDVFTSVLNLSSVPRSLCQLVVQSLTPVPVDTPCAVDADAAPTWPPAQFAPAETRIRTAGQAAAARAAAINAAALAALHAGSIGLRAVPVAIALARHDGAWIVDPTTEEEEASDARAVFAWAFGAGMAAAKEEMTDDESPEGEVVWVAAEGAFSRDEFEEATALSKVAAAEVYDFIKEELGAYYAQRQK